MVEAKMTSNVVRLHDNGAEKLAEFAKFEAEQASQMLLVVMDDDGNISLAHTKMSMIEIVGLLEIAKCAALEAESD
jgi:hypothetical protein